MPIITFKCKCKGCEKEFDKLVKGRNKPGYDFFARCPACGAISQQILAVPSPAQWKCGRSTL